VSVQVATGIAGQRDGAGFTPDLQYGGLTRTRTRTPGARGSTRVKRLAPSQRQFPVEETPIPTLCARVGRVSQLLGSMGFRIVAS
jgi:hypothetical protein